MKNKPIILFLIICLIFVLLAVIGIYIYSNNVSDKQAKVCINHICFNVEVAEDASARASGLMYREKLDEDKGMLFIFPEEGGYLFWMKDTLISLDIIWINKNKEIVFIKKEAQPCISQCEAINPGKEAKYVLEINAGLSDEFGIKEGDKVSLEI